MEKNNTNYFNYRGYICRKDFIWISFVIFILDLLGFYVRSLYYTYPTEQTIVYAIILGILTLYMRFCSITKRTLDINGQKPRYNLHVLISLVITFASARLTNIFDILLVIFGYIWLTVTKGRYSSIK